MEKSYAMVCPRVQEKLEIEKEEDDNCFPILFINLIFQVNHKMDSLIVTLMLEVALAGNGICVAYLFVM